MTTNTNYPSGAILTHSTQASPIVGAMTAQPISVRWTYRSDDPFAVHMEAQGNHAGKAAVHWSFARSILNDGLIGAAGEGDVRVAPVLNKAHLVALMLSSPAGEITLQFDLEDLATWLARTYELVGEDIECDGIDWDREMANLAGPAGGYGWE